MHTLSHKKDSILNNVDWPIVLTYLLLVFAGWVSIYGASYEYDHAVSMFDLSGRAGMQLVWIGTSLILGFIILKLDSYLYEMLAYHIYALLILLLLITIFVAPDIKGSRSWLVITDSIRLQPAEFAKSAVALALAKYMSSHNFKLMTTKNLITVCLLIFIPFLLIILQNETGSALVYIALVLVLFREGLPGSILTFGVIAVALFVVGLKYSEIDLGYGLNLGEFLSIVMVIVICAVLTKKFANDNKRAWGIGIVSLALLLIAYLLNKYDIINLSLGLVALVIFAGVVLFLFYLLVKERKHTYLFVILFALLSMVYVESIDYVFSEILQPHQQQRIRVTLGMEQDALGAGYNVNQSKIAIGSGGFFGKGFLNGTQTKLKYVPEQDTDFIFCTVGEEQGFIGSVGVLLLFGFLITRIIILAEQQKTAFARIYGYAVASILFFHIFINIGMVIGLTPVIGIPLPFFSYGGSSLWGFTILLFIFLRLDMSRKHKWLS